MTFDNILGTIAIAVVMIYLVIALIRPAEAPTLEKPRGRLT